MARTTTSDNEEYFEVYLKGGSTLSGIYLKQGDELPPESVDRAILAAARREAGSGPGNRSSRKWQVPASMAAGLVFAIGMIAVLNQRISLLDNDNSANRVAMAPVTEQSARLADPANKKYSPVETQTAKSEPVDVRQQVLAKAAAGADEQAMAAARESMASVSASPYAGTQKSSVSLSFDERFSLLKQGLKPSQVAVLLGEPSSKTDDLWVYQRLTSTPGKSVEYRVNFNSARELASWNIKQPQ